MPFFLLASLHWRNIKISSCSFALLDEREILCDGFDTILSRFQHGKKKGSFLVEAEGLLL